jgi:hypothetical protein
MSDAQLREYANQVVAGVRELAVQNPRVLAGDMAATADYPVSGSFAWATAFIYSTLYTNPTLDYSSGQKVAYSGTAWGVGFGAGKLWTAGTMVVPANQLVGPADFAMVVVGGMTYIDFSRNGQFLGSVAGAGLSIGLSGVGGSGEFTAA